MTRNKDQKSAAECSLCGDVDSALFLHAACHPSAPLRAIKEGDVLVLRCYVPDCDREVVRLELATSEAMTALAADLDRVHQEYAEVSEVAVDNRDQVIALTAELEEARGQRDLAEQRQLDRGAQLSELSAALEESVKLQAHYAKLLNMHDGGERMIFPTVESWLARLRRLRQ
jgi:hypothetical protein